MHTKELRIQTGSRKQVRDLTAECRTFLHQAGAGDGLLQVVSYANGAHPGMTGRFEILDFPWSTDPGVACIEHRSGALYLEEAHEIEAHTVALEPTCILALSPDDSATMIRDAAEEFS